MGEERVIWEAQPGRLAAYLAEQGIVAVVIEKAPDPPQLLPKSGKFQQVWSEVKQPMGSVTDHLISQPWESQVGEEMVEGESKGR
jgi:hypothetical protein